MNKYLIIIKSGTDYPDFDEEITARNKQEAIDYFYNRLDREFDKDFIRRSIIKIC